MYDMLALVTFLPPVGVCTESSVTLLSDNNCSALLSSALDVEDLIRNANYSQLLVNSSNIAELSAHASFSYWACPDVLECTLGIAECHENSTCVNTAEGYECECIRG